MVEEPTFYGVDIILLPEEIRGEQPHEKGKVIELNGRKSGASFYKAGDYGFYHRVMRNIQEHTGDRRVLLHYSPSTEFKQERRSYEEQTLAEKFDDQERKAREWEEQEETAPMYNAPPLCNIDLENVERKREKKDEFKPSVKRFYYHAAQQLGLNVDTAEALTTARGILRYRHEEVDEEYDWAEDGFWRGEPIAELPREDIPVPNQEIRRIPTEEIGLLWIRSSPNAVERKVLGRDRVFNDRFISDIINDKLLFHYASRLVEPEERVFDPFLPDTFVYGLGLHTQDQFQDWMQETDPPFYVQKPVLGSGGRGVRMHTPEDMEQFDRTPFHSTDPDDIAAGYRDLVLDYMVESNDFYDAMDTHLALLQEGIPSHNVKHPDTGEHHPACARAIVVNGEYMGAIWRSNQAEDNDLTEQLRHNVAAGADVLPVTEEENQLLGEVAEAAVNAFETQKNAVYDTVKAFDPLHPEESYQRSADMRRIALDDVVTLGLVDAAARQHNVFIPEEIQQWAPPSRYDCTVQVQEQIETFWKQLSDASFT